MPPSSLVEEVLPFAHRTPPSKMPEQKAPHARPDYLKTAASGVQASLQATSPAGGSVWGKLVSVFPGRRVRPESAGAQSRASAAPSAQTAKAPRRPMTERLFGTQGTAEAE